MKKSQDKLWGGRFSGKMDRLMEEFNSSLAFDRRLWRQDIQGSKAYAEALAAAGIISGEELKGLADGLDRVAAEIETGSFSWRTGDEDIHMAVENRLTEILGPVGGKLHTGRSRNDQVAVDTRLWVMQAAEGLLHQIGVLQQALLELAKKHTLTLMPGFTHLQQAQVVSLAHYLLSFFWMLERDRDRFREVQQRSGFMPLGSGALAGNALGLDRELLAKKLGFHSISNNSMDAVSDRDFVAEFIFAATLCMVHLSRLAEDLIIFSSSGYGLVTLSDTVTTGSSLMPQKKNPDSCELVRGKTGRIIGNLSGLLATIKGLPSTYNKDLQEDKEPLFDSYDTLSMSLGVMTSVVSTLTVNKKAMTRMLDDFLLATDLADYLVAKGMPFRQAHETVGGLVRTCEQHGLTLRKLPLEEYAKTSGLFTDDLAKMLNFENSLRLRNSPGGTAPEAVEAQIKKAVRVLRDDKSR